MFNLTAFTQADFWGASIASLLAGALIAFSFSFKTKKTPSFRLALTVLPIIVQMVIMIVNGNVGTGVAVMGAFSLVRFRSAPGNAKDICAIFLSMAAGLAMGSDNIALGCILVAVVCVINIIYTVVLSKRKHSEKKELTVVIPEDLNYTEVFEDLFQKYASYYDLTRAGTTNMGSLFKLKYEVVLKDRSQEKSFIDELRTRNGNLEITIGRKDPALVEEL